MSRLASALLIATSILPLFAPAGASAAPGTLGFTFDKVRLDARDVPHLARRQSKTVTASLTNEVLLYFINITAGTPPQSFSLQLDTGSSDIWFPAVNADICQSGQDNCPFGTYDYQASSTYADPGYPDFRIQYVDGTEIQGQYISDVLNIGTTKLTNMTMAAALSANTRGIGIMGIGFTSGEAAATNARFTYPNVIDVLKSEGLINTKAYSLWLDDLESNTGSILFGGVDTNKYHGDLIALPIQIDTQSNAITSFTVAWTGLSITGGGRTSNLSPSTPQPAILDSGTTDTLLPDDIANSIFNGVGVITDPQAGNVVKCSLANDDLTFSFRFGGSNGPLVNVSLSEFVTPLLTTDGSQATFEDGTAACSFAIEAAGQNPILFGDSFLRSAYVVYDLENEEIGLAQTNFKSSPNNQQIKVFSSGAGIPGVTSTAAAATVAQTFGGNPRVTAEGTARGTGQIGGTSRSATFVLSATASGQTGGSQTSNAASSNLRPSQAGNAGIIAAGALLAALVFGGGLILL